ncbi:MAG: thioredoxin-dependent thiol peroxidase [Bryobacteraceae bacterium]
MALQPGDPAPDFELQDADGRALRLSGFRGKSVVLYFYPKADTPGCTKQACGFRDAGGEITAGSAVVLGVSPDKSAALAKFRDKYSLPFPLAADPEHTVAEAYGVWKEKSMYGRKYMGIERTTFLIGPDGRIRRIFAKVKPDGHAAEVLEALAG